MVPDTNGVGISEDWRWDKRKSEFRQPKSTKIFWANKWWTTLIEQKLTLKRKNFLQIYDGQESLTSTLRVYFLRWDLWCGFGCNALKLQRMLKILPDDWQTGSRLTESAPRSRKATTGDDSCCTVLQTPFGPINLLTQQCRSVQKFKIKYQEL